MHSHTRTDCHRQTQRWRSSKDGYIWARAATQEAPHRSQRSTDPQRQSGSLDTICHRSLGTDMLLKCSTNLPKIRRRRAAWARVNQNDLFHVRERPPVTAGERDSAIKDVVSVMGMDEPCGTTDFCHFGVKRGPRRRGWGSRLGKYIGVDGGDRLKDFSHVARVSSTAE